MMSARSWRDCRAFWQTLIFWAWLASFVGGFAGSDLFHAPNCPERLALRAAHDAARGHDAAHGSTVSPSLAAHALQLDAICPSCLLQLGAQGVLATARVLSISLAVALSGARPRPAHAVARALSCGARGPPVAFI